MSEIDTVWRQLNFESVHLGGTNIGRWMDIPFSDLQVMARPQDTFGTIWVRVKPEARDGEADSESGGGTRDVG